MISTTVKTQYRSPISKPLFRALWIWGVGLFLALIIGVDLDGWWLVPLFAGGAGAGFVIWRYYRWPENWSRYLSFGGAVLIALVLNRFLYIADFLVSGERFSEWPFYSGAPEWATFKAEIITVAGTLITLTAWFIAGGAKYSPRLLFDTPRPALRRVLWVTYTFSVVGLLISRLNPEINRALGQLLPTLNGLGTAASLFLPFVLSRNRVVVLVSIAFLSIPFIYVSLLSGMKEEIILSLVPLGYASWILMRNTSTRLATIAAAVVIIPFITSYIGFYREEVWQKKEQLTQEQTINRFANYAEAEGLLNTIKIGTEEFLRRSNAGAYRGWAISLSDESGYKPDLVFSPLLYVFIPRILWPEKPRILQAWEYSGLVFGERYLSFTDSSTSAGLYPAFYLGYGWVAVLIGAFGIGIMIAGLLKLAWRMGGSLLVGLYAISLIPYALRLDESWSVAALSNPVIGFIYLLGLMWVTRMTSAVMKIS